MKVRIVKPCHVNWINLAPGNVVDVDDSIGAGLIVTGYAADSADTPNETATAHAEFETAEAPVKGKGRRK